MFPSDFPEDPNAAKVIADPFVGQCFHNIAPMVLRDMAAGPDEPLKTEWVSPTTKTKYYYDNYVLVTHFDIPVSDLSSDEAEKKFLVEKLQHFGKCFKEVLLSPLFARLHEANCPKESIWLSISGKNPTRKAGGFTFSEYIKNAAVTVDSTKNLNHFVTKAEADSLMDILWKGRKPGHSHKYS